MLRSILYFAVVLAFTGVVFGQSITGSAHDFSDSTWNSSGEICVICHAPHVQDYTNPPEPLWNHQVTTATFTLYSSSTLNATVSQPDGYSKLCLSCHDGTVAIDNFGGNTTGTEHVSGDALIGTDLSNDHPVSFTYDATLATADGGLFDPANTNSGLGGTIDEDMLFGGKLQCASCHNPHDDTVAKFLVKSNATSALCLTCHNK